MTQLLLITIALVAASASPSAQGVACYVIRSGDTISQVALRTTGSASNWRASWFQVVDPTGTRLLAKTRYDAVEPGWRACVTVVSDADLTSAASVWTRAANTMPHVDLNVVLWAVLVIVFAAGSHLADQQLQRRSAVVQTMTRFGERFISEFERPLTASDLRGRPIDSRLRVHPGRAQLEVLLAPAQGRRYPNLSDHRTNVEYDVGRVAEALNEPGFFAGACREQGRWVVVPFHVTSLAQAGGK